MSHATYTLYRRLGHGAMAEVFLARDASGERFALKRIMPHLESNAAVRRRFEDERALALRLDHPNIVRAHEEAHVAGSPYLVLEYVHGVTLRELIALPAARRGQAFQNAALYLVDRVLDALVYAHALRDESGRPLEVVHRDVSPSNVLLTGDGDVKLADFGVARFRDHAELTAPGALVGKLAYLAPEMIRAEPVDARADVYSAGVMLTYLLTAHHPYGDEPSEIVERAARGERRDVSALAAWLSPALRAVLERATASEPDRRFASAAAMRAALAAAGLEETVLRRGRADVGALTRSIAPPERGEEVEEATVTVTVTVTRSRTV